MAKILIAIILVLITVSAECQSNVFSVGVGNHFWNCYPTDLYGNKVERWGYSIQNHSPIVILKENASKPFRAIASNNTYFIAPNMNFRYTRSALLNFKNTTADFNVALSLLESANVGSMVISNTGTYLSAFSGENVSNIGLYFKLRSRMDGVSEAKRIAHGVLVGTRLSFSLSGNGRNWESLGESGVAGDPLVPYTSTPDTLKVNYFIVSRNRFSPQLMVGYSQSIRRLRPKDSTKFGRNYTLEMFYAIGLLPMTTMNSQTNLNNEVYNYFTSSNAGGFHIKMYVDLNRAKKKMAEK